MSKRSAPEAAGGETGPGHVSKSLRHEPGANGFDGGERAGPSRTMYTARGASKDRQHPVLTYRDTEPLAQMCDLYKATIPNQYVEVVIQPSFMNRENQRVKSRQIWGDGIYTPDSDIVAVLMHMGYYSSHLAQPPSDIQEFRVVLKLLPPQEKYFSRLRYVKSRAWYSSNEGCSFQVDKCWAVMSDGKQVHLQPCTDELPAPHCTVQPETSDRPMHTRSATGAAKSKAGHEVSLLYNLCNEPWLKYTLSGVCDKGLKRSNWTSTRLMREVLFLETNSERFQIEYVPAGMKHKGPFRFSKCTVPLPAQQMSSIGVPLGDEWVTEVADRVEWEEFQWGLSSVHLREREYVLKRIHFMPIIKPTSAATPPPEAKAPPS